MYVVVILNANIDKAFYRSKDGIKSGCVKAATINFFH
jgi:hypothetical protein